MHWTICLDNEWSPSSRTGADDDASTDIRECLTSLIARGGQCCIGICREEFESELRLAWEELRCDLGSHGNGAIFVVKRKSPPVSGVRFDGGVAGIVIASQLLDELIGSGAPLRTEKLPFDILRWILSRSTRIDTLLIRQIPHARVKQAGSRFADCRIGAIIAHRGTVSHLTASLASLKGTSRLSSMDVFVGIDEDLSKYRTLMRTWKDQNLKFMAVSNPPMGHFAVKQIIAERITNPVICFQDSDDFSTTDRMVQSLGELEEEQCDLVGCHELRLDEIKEAVEVYRFPLDVNGALETTQSGGLLHGTMMIRRESFLRSGGFTTRYRIASDTQFKLRGYFSLRMRNVDQFLYVRRRHNASLTVSPETALGCPLRNTLRATWDSAFKDVLHGRLLLEDSALRSDHNHDHERLSEL